MHKDAQNHTQPDEISVAMGEQAEPEKPARKIKVETGEKPGTEAQDLSEEAAADEPSEETVEREEEEEETEEHEPDFEDVLAEKDQEIEQLRHQVLRARADLENFRRRTEREKQESLRFANKQIFYSVLEVLDNFERALLSATDPKDNFVIGVSMIHRQLTEVLTQNGVEEIDTKGRIFDPYLDEAIAQEPTADLEENMIIEVFQKGYRYHGSLLRPTKVKVAAALESDRKSEETSEETSEESLTES